MPVYSTAWSVDKMLSLPAKLCMCSSEGAAVTAWGSAGLFTAIPIISTRINVHICLIHSGLLSHKMKQKAEKKRGTRNLQRMFHLHHDPKSGHNLCCHKFTPLTSPFVLVSSYFHVIHGTHAAKACLFCVVWLFFYLLSVPTKPFHLHDGKVALLLKTLDLQEGCWHLWRLP